MLCVRKYVNIDCLLACLLDWLIDWLIDKCRQGFNIKSTKGKTCFIMCKKCITWIDWLFDWLIDWLIDWWIKLLTVSTIVQLKRAMGKTCFIMCQKVFETWIDWLLVGWQHIFLQIIFYEKHSFSSISIKKLLRFA